MRIKTATVLCSLNAADAVSASRQMRPLLPSALLRRTTSLNQSQRKSACLAGELAPALTLCVVAPHHIHHLPALAEELDNVVFCGPAAHITRNNGGGTAWETAAIQLEKQWRRLAGQCRPPWPCNTHLGGVWGGFTHWVVSNMVGFSPATSGDTTIQPGESPAWAVRDWSQVQSGTP